MKNESAGISGVFRWIVLFLACFGPILAGCATDATRAGPEVRQVLAPTGVLRVGLYPGTPTSIIPDSGPGGSRGVGHDLGKEFAHRLGVPFEPVVFQKNAEVLEAVKSGKVDVAFTNASVERAKNMDFTAPYMEIELGYLVPLGSPISSLAEVDRPGMRVGVTEKSSSDGTLSKDLKNARVVRAATLKKGIAMLSAGELDAYATNKATLFEMADALPGSRVLVGRWGLERHALALPKGRDAGMAFARRFAEEARAGGLVQAAIVRAGLRGTVDTKQQ
ncbi:MAG: ABC transporter substrate-binding protein [Sulfuritalea sp.]|jgi:polar amino acid transport system substrate-binding protein|nr:ABC transporter substrate-binding protein [Sulfuritalea sp.]